MVYTCNLTALIIQQSLLLNIIELSSSNLKISSCLTGKLDALATLCVSCVCQVIGYNIIDITANRIH